MTKSLEHIETEGVISIKELSPGIYIVHTEKTWETLKDRIRNGEVNSGFNAFVPSYVKEVNEKAKTPEGREEILRRLWGEDWEKHPWGQ